MTGQHRAGSRLRRPGPHVVLLTAALSCLLAGGALLGYIHWYQQRAASTSARLTDTLAAVRPAERAVTGPDGAHIASCIAPDPSAPGPAGAARMNLTVPAIGLRAPVLAGTTDSQLNVAVGHLDGSRWPDQGGTVVLEAHDVTFFARLEDLKPGATITLTAPCRTWTYRLDHAQVVPKGAPISDQTDPTLVLVTCWPTNALYYTNHRYVVHAALVSASTASRVLSAPPTLAAAQPVLPAQLQHADLGVDRLGIPLGELTSDPGLAGQFSQSAAAYADTAAVEHLLVAALLTGRAQDRTGWSVLAPDLPYSVLAPFSQPGDAVTWRSAVNVHLTGAALHVTGGTASGLVRLGPPNARRTYKLTMTVQVRNQAVRITGWDLRPTT